jgi:hypothetical protein
MLGLGDLLTQVQRKTPVVQIILNNESLDFATLNRIFCFTSRIDDYRDWCSIIRTSARRACLSAPKSRPSGRGMASSRSQCQLKVIKTGGTPLLDDFDPVGNLHN